MALDANDPRPPFRQIAADLRLLIGDGTLAAGAKLPSTRELGDRYEVASQTVQSAIRLLRAEGLVRSIQGRGTFVVDDLDPATVVTADPSHGPTAEYVILRQQIDRLAGEVDEIRQQLAEVAARLPEQPAQQPPARKSRSATRPR